MCVDQQATCILSDIHTCRNRSCSYTARLESSDSLSSRLNIRPRLQDKNINELYLCLRECKLRSSQCQRSKLNNEHDDNDDDVLLTCN